MSSNLIPFAPRRASLAAEMQADTAIAAAVLQSLDCLLASVTSPHGSADARRIALGEMLSATVARMVDAGQISGPDEGQEMVAGMLAAMGVA